MAKRPRKRGGKVVWATPLLTLNGMLSNEIVRELGGRADDAEALRLALLHCVLLLQDNEEPAVRNFCTYLLTRFKPLAGQLRENKHPFFKDVEVMRAQTADGAVTLLLPLERLAKTLGLPLPEDK